MMLLALNVEEKRDLYDNKLYRCLPKHYNIEGREFYHLQVRRENGTLRTATLFKHRFAVLEKRE